MNLAHLKEDLSGIREKSRKLNILVKSKNVFAVMLFMVTMPFPVYKNKQVEAAYVTKAKLDTGSKNMFVFESDAIEIKIGDSLYGKKEQARIAAEKVAKELELAKAKTIVSAKSVATDPAEFKSIYMDAGNKYSVPWQILEAVHQVETGKSGSTGKSSYAGATGPMQFLPSTWRHYGVDGNSDGTSDITDVTDAIHGAANYLAAGGAASGNVPQALFNYNHSSAYVNKVLGIAREIGYNQ
ncbi:MAG: lytic transglycosylase domain-containing protein [Patescibacteria group bacterium]|jgi:membrane-bound lytic murein transglycosylase B